MSNIDPDGLWCVWEDGTHDPDPVSGESPGAATTSACAAGGGHWDSTDTITGIFQKDGIVTQINSVWGTLTAANGLGASYSLEDFDTSLRTMGAFPASPDNSGRAANNGWSLFGWDASAWKTFFKTAVNPLPELREGGCGRAFLDAFAEGGLFPDGGPGTEPDSVIKQAGGIAAAQYVVNQGLVVPLRSSIYRGILEGTETAASGAVLADVYTREAQGFSAEYSAFKAGACH
jgi:hypothetical protein